MADSKFAKKDEAKKKFEKKLTEEELYNMRGEMIHDPFEFPLDSQNRDHIVHKFKFKKEKPGDQVVPKNPANERDSRVEEVICIRFPRSDQEVPSKEEPKIHDLKTSEVYTELEQFEDPDSLSLYPEIEPDRMTIRLGHGRSLFF